MGSLYLYDGYASINNLKNAYALFSAVTNEVSANYAYVDRNDNTNVEFITERIDAWQELNIKLYRFYASLVNALSRDRWVPYTASIGSIGSTTLHYGVSPQVTASISVSSVATVEKDRSDEFSDPMAPLSLEGTFYLNGGAVSISTDDSLFDISQKINSISSGTRVASYIGDGYLYIYSLYTGSAGIDYEDPDGVLQSLGVLTVEDGVPVPKSQVSSPSDAVLTVNGRTYKQASNLFKDILPHVDIEVSSSGSSSFRLLFSIDAVKGMLKSIIDKYNDAMREINKHLSYKGALSGDRSLGLIRKNISLPWKSTKVNPVGIDLLHKEMDINEFSLVMYASRLKEHLINSLFRSVDGLPSLVGSLSAIGVYSNDDSTLSFNEEQFSSKMREDYTSVVPVLAGDNGILKRIKDYLFTVVGTEPSLITSKIDSLEEELGNMEYLKERYERLLWSKISLLYKRYSDISSLLSLLGAERVADILLRGVPAL